MSMLLLVLTLFQIKFSHRNTSPRFILVHRNSAFARFCNFDSFSGIACRTCILETVVDGVGEVARGSHLHTVGGSIVQLPCPSPRQEHPVPPHQLLPVHCLVLVKAEPDGGVLHRVGVGEVGGEGEGGGQEQSRQQEQQEQHDQDLGSGSSLSDLKLPAV